MRNGRGAMIILRDNSSGDSIQPHRSGHARQLETYPTSGWRRPDENDRPGERNREEDEDMASWAGQPSIKGSSESMRMALLTMSLIGIQ